MSVLKRSLVLLNSFKQSYSVIRTHKFLILQCFFFLVLCCRITMAEYNGVVEVICKTFR